MKINVSHFKILFKINILNIHYVIYKIGIPSPFNKHVTQKKNDKLEWFKI